MENFRVLILEDSRTDAEMIQRLLSKTNPGNECLVAGNRQSFEEALETFSPNVILSDHSLPQFDSLSALLVARKKFSNITFIMVTGTVSEEFAAEIIKQGADDYILKDRMFRLPSAIEAAVKKRKALEEISAYKFALDQSAIVAITDQKGIIVYANDNFSKISKYSTNELVGKDHRIVNSGYHPSFFIKNLWSTIANGNIWRGEFCNKAKDGSLYWVDTTIIPFLNERRKPYQYLSIRNDITEKKRAEEELRKSEASLKEAQTLGQISNFEVDLSTNSYFWSDEYYRIFGVKKSEVSPSLESFLSFLHPDDAKRMKLDIELGIQAARDTAAEFRFIKDGDTRFAYTEIKFEFDRKGNPVRLFGILQDITERKRAEAELRNSEMRLNEAQTIAHISNYEVDLEQRIHTWSEEYYRILGLNKEKVTPSLDLFLSFIHPEDAEITSKKIRSLIADHVNSSIEFKFIRNDGAVRYGYSEWKFEFDSKGKATRLFGIMQDITARKEAENEIKASHERFEYATKASSDIIWELNFVTEEYKVHEGKAKLFGPGQIANWQAGIDGNYIIEQDREKVKQSFSAARAEPARQLWEMEYRVNSIDHTVMCIINHAIFIRNDKGKALRAIGAITDISERKRLEDELLEQQREEQRKITATALEAQEKERIAIGIELHDNVNQILVGSNLILSMINSNPEKAEELITKAMFHIKDAIRENRKIAHLFVAPDMNTEKLTDQLKKLMNTMLKAGGLKTKLIAAHFEEGILDRERKVNIYRIAQEQCTNIIKYAAATEVKISLSIKDNLFKMSIADNGVGMDNVAKVTGIGLKNINGRLSVFNGHSIIKTSPGKGFILEIVLPCT